MCFLSKRTESHFFNPLDTILFYILIFLELSFPFLSFYLLKMLEAFLLNNFYPQGLTPIILQMPLTTYACLQAPANLPQSPPKSPHRLARLKSPSSILATKSSTAPALLSKQPKVWWSCQKTHPHGRNSPAAPKTSLTPSRNW